MGHRRGESRQQATLFPVMLDELVAASSLVRVIDAWVETLDLKSLGFAKAQAQVMGTPPYDPADLLKLYICGYLNAVRSSRALERECHRNVEVMWLLQRLRPDHKTISEFRRTNSQALVATAASFIQFARAQKLVAGTTVAIDGTKIRAVASRKAILRKDDLEAQALRNAQQIEQYLRALDAQDAQEVGCKTHEQDVQRALRYLEGQQALVQSQLDKIRPSRVRSVVQGEPDAQVMLHGGLKAPGYNLQTAVESTSHLIVAHDVTREANDLRQLAPMAQAASAALDQAVTAVADAGYSNGEHLAQLDAQGITSFVPVARAVNQQGDGTLYEHSAFHYDQGRDCFICPAGKVLHRKQIAKADKMVIYAAQPQDCSGCGQKRQCTNASRRFVARHLYEDALQATQQRLTQRPEMMRLRRQTVEHPFADIKHRILGNARLLVRGLSGARSELSLAVLAYNIKRAVNMKGAHWMCRAVQG